MESLLFSFLTALSVSFFLMPAIIRISNEKHLFDIPDDRKSHQFNIPTLGGVAIFAGLIFAMTFWANQKLIQELQYIIASLLILFFTGLKDDLMNIRAYKKLMVQIVSAFIIVHWTEIRLTTFYGLFGIWDIEVGFSYALSIFTIVALTNAFNLIDGIDGLAATIGILCSAIFGYWFFLMGSDQFAILAFSLLGSLFGFLYYNWSPAKIFMGDTGSLIVGFVISILAVKFIEMNRIMDKNAQFKIHSVPVVTIAILIVPIFDTLRVFLIRIMKRKSPFIADRSHVHHVLLSIGLSHQKCVLIILIFNILLISLNFFLKGHISGEVLLVINLLLPTFSMFLITSYKKNSFKSF